MVEASRLRLASLLCIARHYHCQIVALLRSSRLETVLHVSPKCIEEVLRIPIHSSFDTPSATFRELLVVPEWIQRIPAMDQKTEAGAGRSIAFCLHSYRGLGAITEWDFCAAPSPRGSAGRCPGDGDSTRRPYGDCAARL